MGNAHRVVCASRTDAMAHDLLRPRGLRRLHALRRVASLRQPHGTLCVACADLCGTQDVRRLHLRSAPTLSLAPTTLPAPTAWRYGPTRANGKRKRYNHDGMRPKGAYCAHESNEPNNGGGVAERGARSEHVRPAGTQRRRSNATATVTHGRTKRTWSDRAGQGGACARRAGQA